MDTLKSGIALYVASVLTPDLDGSNSATCSDEASKKIYISLDSSVSPGTAPTGWTFGQVGSTAYNEVDGTGWLPVNFEAVLGGSPIPKLPIDPTNSTDGTPSDNDLYYRYGCLSGLASSPLTCEIAAVMESGFYKAGCTRECNDISGKDGGNLPT